MENDRFILNRNSDVKVIYIGTGQFQLASGKEEHNLPETEKYF